jgi:glutamate-ammonia-ligase adenylyltransferase
MKNSLWAKVAKASADPERAAHFFQLLAGSHASQFLQTADLEQLRLLAGLFSGTQGLSTTLLRRPEWLHLLEPELLRFPRRKQGLLQEIARWVAPALEAKDYVSALGKLREFKQMEMLRIATRDLAKLATLPDIVLELSTVADVCLGTVWQICMAQMIERHGTPCHLDSSGNWRPSAGCVLGMGKLGGQELNYSSDVDLLFVYTEEGGAFKTLPPSGTNPRPALTNHQFFNKTAESFISEVCRMTPEGVLYRVDMRLRPEGDSGPLTRSIGSYENYYAQWGQTWERMMLIKARGVAGDAMLASEFLEMVQPFRYPRSVNQNVLREVAAMKDRIEHEVVKSGEIDRNVKLGRGGIREIEFITQSLQLLHAGRQPFLQSSQTLPCLAKLVEYEHLTAQDSRQLQDAYCFLRDVEHRLQMENDLQTHTIPDDKGAQARLARLSGFATLRAFESARRTHMRQVRKAFIKVLKADKGEAAVDALYPGSFEGAESDWKQLLMNHGFKDPDKALRMLREFVEGPGFIHVSPRTVAVAKAVLPRLFALCKPAEKHAPENRPKQPPLSDPDRVLTRLDSFISAYGARATLFELWNSNPAIFELLLLLFDRSEFLAELAIRSPDLVDELVASDRLRQRKTADETLRDLRHGLADEDQHLWLRRYHQAELMRIGLRDILGLAGSEQYLTELSALAEACLQYALEVVMARSKLSAPPFAVIGMGKLGGAEIDYGSDLDILFVANTTPRSLPALTKHALALMDLVSARTEQGLLFQTDARLRPDGEKGLLVNSLKAYGDYYRNRAQLWEIQSLTRARPVAGDANVGNQFLRLAAELTAFDKPQPNLVAYSPDWKQKIHRMRMRIEQERSPRGQGELAIKTGVGGLMDAEFIAQALCLEHGWRETNTLAALQRADKEGLLPNAGKFIDGYREIRRVEAILRRWSYEGESVLPADPAPFTRVSVRCGFASPEAFKSSLIECRQAVREAYLTYFQKSLG